MFLLCIQAKEKSERIPNKNTVLLGDKPLIAWTIEDALEYDGDKRVIVETDGDYIEEIASSYGVEVYRRKPEKKELKDAAEDLLNHLYKTENFLPEGVIFLFVTSPFRESDLIERCVDLWQGVNSVFTVKRDWNWYAAGHINDGIFNFREGLDEERSKRTQDAPAIYTRVGSVYVCSVKKEWIKNGNIYLPDNFYLFPPIKVVVQSSPYSIDIDDYEELGFARTICHLF